MPIPSDNPSFNPSDPSTFSSLGPLGQFNFDPGMFAFGDPMSGGQFLDTMTGQIVSAADAMRIDPNAWAQQFLGSQQATMSPNTPMLQPPGAPSPTQGGGSGGFNLGSLLPRDPKTGDIDWTKMIGGPAALLAAGGGLAGIIQALKGGGQTSKTVNQFPPATAQQIAAQQQGLQNLQGAGQFAFGGAPGGGGTPGVTGGTPGGGGGGGLAGLYSGQQPFLNAAFLQALQQQAGQIGGNPFLGQQLPQQLAGQVGGYGGAQGSLLGLQGLGAANLGPRLAGTGAMALQGNLPPLSPELMHLINQTYAGGEAAIQSEADTALTGALEQARRQGFAGGLDVFREGTPGALLAPGLQTATRERAMLEGQKAQTIFGLMQGLPQMGGTLAAQGQGLLNQAAGAYTTPLSVSLQGGQNLAGLNQNVIQALLNAGHGGLGLQNQFLGALGGQTGAAGALSNAFQPLGSTQMQTQPFNLLSAMAPTANLLGGIGGVLTAMNPRPQINFQLPGGTTA